MVLQALSGLKQKQAPQQFRFLFLSYHIFNPEDGGSELLPDYTATNPQ
jgi:hypothetical protein